MNKKTLRETLIRQFADMSFSRSPEQDEVFAFLQRHPDLKKSERRKMAAFLAYGLTDSLRGAYRMLNRG